MGPETEGLRFFAGLPGAGEAGRDRKKKRRKTQKI